MGDTVVLPFCSHWYSVSRKTSWKGICLENQWFLEQCSAIKHPYTICVHAGRSNSFCFCFKFRVGFLSHISFTSVLFFSTFLRIHFWCLQYASQSPSLFILNFVSFREEIRESLCGDSKSLPLRSAKLSVFACRTSFSSNPFAFFTMNKGQHAKMCLQVHQRYLPNLWIIRTSVFL